jgi:hypothetical protein
VPTKAKVVRDDRAWCPFAVDTKNEIDWKCRIELCCSRCGWNEFVFKRQQHLSCFQCSGCAKRMASDTFATCNRHCAFTKHCRNCLGFGGIVHWSRCSVSVRKCNVRSRKTGVVESKLHARDCSSATKGRSGYVVGIGFAFLTQHFAKNSGSSSLCEAIRQASNYADGAAQILFVRAPSIPHQRAALSTASRHGSGPQLQFSKHLLL